MSVKASTPTHATHARGPVLEELSALSAQVKRPARNILQKVRYQLEETSIPFNSIG